MLPDYKVYSYRNVSSLSHALVFFSVCVESRMMVTNKYVYYCLQTYFFFLHQFIPLVHWLVFISSKDDGTWRR